MSSLEGVVIINDGTPGVIGTLIKSNSFLNLLINLIESLLWWIRTSLLLFHINCEPTKSNTSSYFMILNILLISSTNLLINIIGPTINISSTYSPIYILSLLNKNGLIKNFKI